MDFVVLRPTNMTATSEQTSTPDARRTEIVDVDVHERAALEELVPYLEPQWRRYITEYGWQPERLLPYAQPTAGGLDRADAKLPDGRPGGSDLGLVREQLLDLYDIDVAVLTGWLNATALGAGWPEFKTGLMSAYNDWQVETWLERDQRLVGSVHVNAHDPVGAAREIERMADHPRIVQVMLYIGDRPFGDPFYEPVFAAAERHGLVVGIHHSENSPTALGHHRLFAEWHTLVSQVFMSQTVSLVFNGVFERHPGLQVAMIEGGFSWVPHIMWRSDQQWRELRSEVPWLRRKPSDVIREHVRFATQPIEEMTARQFLGLIEQMESDELILLSSDYPHWDFDSPQRALPGGLPEDLTRRIFAENARAIYRLPA
jgi:predicted TIM-barrel fold metal-dependent hydrolase